MYDPASGRFTTKDSWQGDYNRPLSLNRWNYVYANPINDTDPSGHSPLGQNPCDGQPNYEICYARWIVSTGGELTEDIIQSIYNQYPEDTLQLIQEQFSIKLPTGYSFRMARGGTAFNPNQPYEGIFGVNWWFTRYNYLGTMFEFSDQRCGVLSSVIPPEALHIDYSIYITKHTFSDWKYSPDDLAGIMIHEAVHAWQESVASSYVVAPGQPNDPSSYSWLEEYRGGIERQGIDIALDANATGRIHISSELRNLLRDYRKRYDGWFGTDFSQSPDFPYPLPPNVP